jgi:hypothetical protein
MQQPPLRTGGQTTWTAEAARDRLSSTAFLAALFHGILILGITFSADSPDPENLTSSMEVVLVTSEYEDRAPSDTAVLLAQQNLGSRNVAPDGPYCAGAYAPRRRAGPARMVAIRQQGLASKPGPEPRARAAVLGFFRRAG